GAGGQDGTMRSPGGHRPPWKTPTEALSRSVRVLITYAADMSQAASRWTAQAGVLRQAACGLARTTARCSFSRSLPALTGPRSGGTQTILNWTRTIKPLLMPRVG